MENTGECKGHDCSFIGQFEGATTTTLLIVKCGSSPASRFALPHRVITHQVHECCTGFTFHDIKTVALYLIIVDPLMYNTVAG
jgi:hypothetical protein